IPWYRRLLLLLTGLLLLSGLSAAAPAPQSVWAQTSVEPVLDIPPSYYRPGLSNWLVLHQVRLDRNDPINIIVYGPPDRSRFNPKTDLIAAIRNATDPIYPDWYDNFRTILPPDFIPGVDEKCYNELGYAPVDVEPDREISGMWTSTECPALFGTGERLRFRHWDYLDPTWEINASYLSASFTEDFAIPFRCSDEPPLGKSHCLTNFDNGRNTVGQLIRIGANKFGWKVRSYDLLGAYPRHQNIQPGPYDGVNDWRQTGQCPFQYEGCQIDPPLVTENATTAIYANGDVRVICIDKDSSSDYCDQKPAERPLAISALTPANGSFLATGQTTDFSVQLDYSDEFRAMVDVTFIFNYTDQSNNLQRIRQPANLVSGDGNDGVWQASLSIPSDVALDLATGTQFAGLRIEICDNHGEQTGNADDTACWTYRNLRYVLRPLPDCTEAAFVFDTTGSMDGILGNVQSAATEIVSQLLTANPSARVAVVEYRDGEEDSFGASTVLALSNDQTAIVSAINSLSAGGGGDDPEFVLSGVQKAVGLPWSEAGDKVIILIGDASSKDPEPLTGYTANSVASAANAEGIAIYGLPLGASASASFSPLANQTGGALYPIDGYASTVEAIKDACNLP
ncbi:VWA domain-containing protein, partial [Candidatus Gracilibacteria bacterium]|nr:VWA domain-containing protein [Candidatus Gracilibacteria bacterium]